MEKDKLGGAQHEPHVEQLYDPKTGIQEVETFTTDHSGKSPVTRADAEGTKSTNTIALDKVDRKLNNPTQLPHRSIPNGIGNLKLSDSRSGPQALPSLSRGSDEMDDTPKHVDGSAYYYTPIGSVLVEGIQNGNQDDIALQDDQAQHSPRSVPDYLSSSSNSKDEEYMIEDNEYITAPPSAIDSEPPRIRGFAKLEFADGQFYLNTYAVELGRDPRVAREITREITERRRSGARTARAEGYLSGEDATLLLQEESPYPPSSGVSENGDMIGLGASNSNPNQASHTQSRSITPSSQQLSRRNSMIFETAHTDYQSLAMASLLISNSPSTWLDPLHHMPAPDACPFIPIHATESLAKDMLSSPRSISRRHMRIAFNFEAHLFEATIYGRNGAFIDDSWYPPGNIRPLRSGSLLQIGGVRILFTLPPNVALGDFYPSGAPLSDPDPGHEVSSDHEAALGTLEGNSENHDVEDKDDDDGVDGDDEDIEAGEDDDEDEDEVAVKQSFDEDEDEVAVKQSFDEEDFGKRSTILRKPPRPKVQSRGKAKLKGKAKSKRRPRALGKPKSETKPQPQVVSNPDPITSSVVPKRKGPGRPPKNGIMSKREQALLARQAREAAKAEAQGLGVQPNHEKARSADSNEIQQADASARPVVTKRKYTKRKNRDLQSVQANGLGESTEQTDSIQPEYRAPKEKKPPKRPRSPSPVFDESTLTPEQLAKPHAGYVVLIYDAIKTSTTGTMSLPQIYRAIERKYPYFKLRVQTTGWQSSVRHNLSQHNAFARIEKDGKGWLWGIVPDVSIEKEKKRRASPPPTLPQQPYYPPVPHMAPHPYPYHGMHPNAPMPQQHPPGPMPQQHLNGPMPPQHPNGPMPQQHSNGPMPQQHHYHPYGLPPGPLSYPVAGHHSSSGRINVPMPFLNGHFDRSSTYQSPYRSNPRVQPPPTSPPPQSQPQVYNPSQSYSNGQNGYQADNHTDPLPSASPNPANNPPIQTPTPAPSAQQTDISASTPSPPHPSANISPSILQAIDNFKKNLLSTMPDNPRSEALVTSAINRVLGMQSNSGESDGGSQDPEDPQEIAISKALLSMLDSLSRKTSEAQQRRSSQPPAMIPQLLPLLGPRATALLSRALLTQHEPESEPTASASLQGQPQSQSHSQPQSEPQPERRASLSRLNGSLPQPQQNTALSEAIPLEASRESKPLDNAVESERSDAGQADRVTRKRAFDDVDDDVHEDGAMDKGHRDKKRVAVG